MIGKAYKSRVPYYDRITRSQKFKSRPCLIIGQADSGDYVILPISTVSDKSRIDPIYDIPLDKETYRFLKKDSYLRTHKQTVVNIASLRDQLSDFKATYGETYLAAIMKVEEFQKQLITDALYGISK